MKKNSMRYKQLLSFVLCGTIFVGTVPLDAWASSEMNEETKVLIEETEAETIDADAENVRDMINDLPSVETFDAMNSEEQMRAYENAQTAYDAYEGLSEVQRTLLVEESTRLQTFLEHINSKASLPKWISDESLELPEITVKEGYENGDRLPYKGEPYTITFEGVPEDTSIQCCDMINNKWIDDIPEPTDVGFYQYVFYFEKTNYIPKTVWVSFYIVPAENGWIKKPSMQVSYGIEEVIQYDSGQPKFGSNVKVLYEDGNRNKLTGVPTEPGIYWAVFEVAGTENYSPLTERIEFCIRNEKLNISGVSPENAVYDGEKHKGYTGTPTAGELYGPTKEYTFFYEGMNGTNYSSNEAPVNAGTYRLKIRIPFTNTDYAGETYIDFKIDKKNANVTLPEQIIEQDGEIDKESVTISNLAEGDTAEVRQIVKYSYDCQYDAEIVICNQDGEQVNSNYNYDTKGEYHECAWDTDKHEYKCINCQAVKATDSDAPTAVYQIGTAEEKAFLSVYTYGLFSKDSQEIRITAKDTESGVSKVEYCVTNSANSTISEDMWNEYTETIKLQDKGIYYVYVRVTDKAGNRALLHTEGIVLFKDSTANAEISYEKKSQKDTEAGIAFYGNTVKEVCYNGTAGAGQKPSKDNDYRVTATGIIFTSDYLETLPVSNVPYTFTVIYNAQGVEQGSSAYGDVPETTTIHLKVTKKDASVEITENISKHYDGKAVSRPAYTSKSDGAPTYEYKVRGAQDSTYTTSAPIEAGEYVVRVTVSETADYKKSSDTFEFEITEAYLDNVGIQYEGHLVYNGQPQAVDVSVSADTVDGKKAVFTYSTDENGTYSENMPMFTEAGEYDVYYRVSAKNHRTSEGYITVIIDKQILDVPTLDKKVYNGKVQKAEIPENVPYTAEKNDGGMHVGTYDVTLKLKDCKNYQWKDTEAQSVTTQFQIIKAQNAWTIEPSIQDWNAGSLASVPKYAAKFGAVKVNYSGTANDGTKWNQDTAPVKAGHYKVKFTVEATEDYEGLEKELTFSIKPLTQTESNGRSDSSENPTTGDTMPITLWWMIFGTSFMMILGIFLSFKKKK